MKPIASAITGLPSLAQGQPSSTGQRPGETGSPVTSARCPSDVSPPTSPAAVADLLASLQDLQTRWGALKLGRKLGTDMTPQETRESLSTLNQLLATGKPDEVARIVGRLLALYPDTRERPDSVVEDWLRKLLPLPLACIWTAYDAVIERPGKFAPSLGDFIGIVKQHMRRVELIKFSIIEGQTND